MQTKILVAGATGNLGAKIVKALHAKDAVIAAIVRTGSDAKKLAELEQLGVQLTKVRSYAPAEIADAFSGVTCVVSALQGLQDVIVDTQQVLLDAALAAGVARFIPSDYSSDYTKLVPGDNRNFDIRREFFQRIDESTIAATSVLNGAFAEILAYGTPLLDFKKKSVGYWEDADIQLDFTSMDNTASFTAAAALDADTPRILRIAGFQVSPRELQTIASELTGSSFALVRMGSLEELAASNRQQRAANPEGEEELYPRWQNSQYVQSMFSVQLDPLDNDRYAGIKWTSAREWIQALVQQQR